MGTKLIVMCVLCAMSCSCTVINSKIVESANIRDNTNEIKYAVAYCLSKAYPETEFSRDATHVAGAYLQRGTYGINLYEDIRSLVDSYRAEKLTSKHDMNLNIMQCLNLYESSSLKALIKEMTIRQNQ